MDEKRRERLRREAENGRRWQTALEVLGEFCEVERESLVNQLELGETCEVEQKVLMLKVLRQFKDLATMSVKFGQQAERELSDGDEEKGA